MAKEHVHRFVSKDLTIRMASVNATEVVQQMQALQNTFPLATVAVGRSMVGALLMASQLKEGNQVGLLFRGNGSLGSVYAEAAYNGQVRGYTPNPQYQPPNYDNGLSLKDAIGNGTLSVSQHQPFQKQPFHGTVELVSGEIGQDIAHYLHQSHQIQSVVSLGVYLDTYGKVQAAGGVLIEAMPGVSQDTIDAILGNYEIFKPNVSKMLTEGATPFDLIEPFMLGIPFQEVDHNYPMEYFCPCTKDRVVRALETLGEAELEDMIQKNETAAVTCQICGRPYAIEPQEIAEIKDKVHKSSMH